MHVTPGRLTATWVLLRSLHKLGNAADEKELLRYAQRSGLRGGGLPIGDGYQIALTAGFIVKREASVEVTDFGSQALGLCSEPEPNSDILRLFLSVLVLRHPPTWAAVFQGNPNVLEVYLSDAELKMLREAELLPRPGPEDLAGWAWWEALDVVPADIDEGAARKAIGDAGEALSIAHERQRLITEGFPKLAASIRWVARESPAYGFDIASYCGATFGNNPNRALAIEVKSISTPSAQRIAFYLTRHEADIAARLGEHYLIHYWDGVSPSSPPKSRDTQPRLLRFTDVAGHLPPASPCHPECRWETAHIEFNLAR